MSVPTDPLVPLDERSKALRLSIIDALEGGARGHVGSSLSLVEILRVLFDDVMHFDSERPAWELRDRFLLSKGHGCLALYAMLADKGFFPAAELRRFCRPGALLGGHPERGKVPGVEASTGALGHGLSIGVGMALAARMKRRDGERLPRVFVVMGDGEIDEGSVWEAALSASKHKLSNLLACVDYNKIQSYGEVREVLPLEPLADKWRAFGFAVQEVDGHDVEALRTQLARSAPDQPSMLICHTIKGRGLDFAEGDPHWHHKSSISDELVAQMRQALEASGA